jgi:hypothetical protein
MSTKWLHVKLATAKAAIVLIPSYSVAFFTDKMVWVVPTLAAASFFAGTIDIANGTIRRRVDEDQDTETDDGTDSQSPEITDKLTDPN